jgi:hypothetical protein
VSELDSIQPESGAPLGIVPYALGDSGSDLVYTPVTPCRIIDTRLAGGPITPGTNRNFAVTGSGYAGQGGNSGSCGIPYGPATAAVINLIAVNPVASGDLRVTPYGTPIPLASIINYAALPALNIANGPVVTLCNPATTTCTADITIQADVSATHLVADVQGYFSAFPTSPVGVCGANDVSLGGHCYYLDGSKGVCDPGYSVWSQSALGLGSPTIASRFVGLNYKHTVSQNCCIYNADAVENWGMAAQCNAAGPFTAAPAAGAASCTGSTNFFTAQLTLCGK